MKQLWKKAAALALGLVIAIGAYTMPAQASNAVYNQDVRDDADTVYIGFCNGAEENNVSAYKFPLYVTPKDYVDQSFGADYPSTEQVNDLAYNGATVVYCMDANKAEPNKMVNASEDGRGRFQQMLNISEPGTYTEACTTKSNNFSEEETMLGLAYLAKYGYPNGDASFQGSLTDAEYRAVTQWAVYYYTRGYYGTAYANLFGGLNAAQQVVAKRFQIDAIRAAEPDLDVAATLQQYALIFKPLNRATTGDYQYLFGMRAVAQTPNAVKTYTIKFEKINLVGEELSDATFTLTNLDTMDQVAKWTFDGTYYKVDLVAGNYELNELEAPQGYQLLGQTVVFNLDENGVITIKPFTGTGDAYVTDNMISLLNLEEAQGGNGDDGNSSQGGNGDDGNSSQGGNGDDNSSSRVGKDNESSNNSSDGSDRNSGSNQSSNNGNQQAHESSSSGADEESSTVDKTDSSTNANAAKTAPKTGESAYAVWFVLFMTSLAGIIGLIQYRKTKHAA